MGILIYSKEITSRIEYIFHLLLTDWMDCPVSFTEDFEQFNLHSGPKINYSTLPSADGWFLKPAELLFENGITKQQIEVFDYKNTKAFFKTSNDAVIPFDIFAASFYLISRYEEYMPFKADKHERFPAMESLAFKNNFLHQPAVDIWLKDLKNALVEQYPDIKFKTKKYQFISTIDVDNGYAYLGKSWWRSLGALIKLIIKLDFKKFEERISVLYGFKKDPFDLYDIQRSIQDKYKFTTIYFLLCGNPAKNDHNILPHGKHFQKLVLELLEFTQIGLHPSYKSNKFPLKIASEKETLENIAQKEISISRQHFLKLKFPNTYNNLIKAGIKEDYTMGYASHPGFRAGTCSPFKFYNLIEEQATNLTIFPFAVMDGTLMNYMQVKSTAAMGIIKPLIEQVKNVNGLFISIWHDSTFARTAEYQDRRGVYEEMVKAGVEN